MTVKLKFMSEKTKKVLFFIKCPTHNLKPLETFLSKRNFVIHTESEIKEALTKAIEMQPEFIFLAWDHENPRIQTLPKLLSQACSGQVVPYIMSNSRDASRKLNMCPLNPKLYPPVSGPAIERLVMKANKQGPETGAARASSAAAAKEKADLITIKSKLMANLDAGGGENEFSSEESRQQHQQQRVLRQQSIAQKNSVLKQSSQNSLDSKAAENLKRSFQEKIQIPLENLMRTLAESDTPEDMNRPAEGANSNSGIIIQQGLSNPRGLGTTIEEGVKSEPLSSPIQESATAATGSSIEKKYMGPITAPHLPTEQNTRIYGIAVYSESWCGYLLLSTAMPLEFSSVDMIFTDWAGSQLQNMQEIDEKDFFELEGISPENSEKLLSGAEFTQQALVNGYSLQVSFFTVDPANMLVELNEDRDLIQVSTEIIPADVEINFSLHLHLPENKKYLLYTQANRSLNGEQKNRLLSNQVLMLYTPLEYEKEYKLFLAEKTVKELCGNLISRKFRVV